MRFRLALFAVVILVSSTHAAALSENEKIVALIKSVEEMPARFMRNGAEYGAKQAADHLRLKWNKAGSRVKSAQDFIRYCGSQSSMSGEKYKIKFADGRVIESEVYLSEKLKEIESKGWQLNNGG